MSDLIRGGQVTFHKFRMLMQVGKVLSRLSLLLIIVSIAYSFWENISANEWRVASAWIKKDLYVWSSADHEVTYPNRYGRDITIQARYMDRDTYAVSVIKKFEDNLYKSFMLAGIMLTVVIGGIIFYFWIKGRNIKRSKNLRGIFGVTEKDLKKQIKLHNKPFKDYTPFELANFPYPITGRLESWSSGEQSHTLLLGSTGAGKTTIIQNLISQLRARNQKAIIIDIKGDFIQNYYQASKGDIILNPLDVRGRNWSIFKETNPLKGFSTIAKSLLPKDSKGDPIWIDAARGVVAELANLYVSENLSMSEFADKILKSDLTFLANLLQKTSASKIINEDIEKADLSVLMMLSTYLRPLKLYRSAENCFSITDWVNDEGKNNFLFIGSRADVKEDINPIITTQVDIAVNALRSLKSSSNVPKIWFILDEIPYFDNAIPSLKDGLATARSFGGCFVLGSQDMSSIAKIYSRETAESIANNCKTKVFMNIAGKESAQWCSDSLGEGEIEEWHEGLSYGAHEMRDGIQVNQNRIIRKNVLPSELMMLKSGQGFINFAGFAPAKFNFSDFYFKKITDGYIENTELYALFKKELEEGEKRRKEIEAQIVAKINDSQTLKKDVVLGITKEKSDGKETSIDNVLEE